jgi:hypothetical protein
VTVSSQKSLTSVIFCEHNFYIFNYIKIFRDFYVSLLYEKMVYKTLKNSQNFLYCEKCNYYAKRKTDFQKHLETKKHNDTKMIQNDTQKLSKINLSCECGKKYKYHSGYYRHKKQCIVNEEQKISKNKNHLIELKEMFTQMIKQNNETNMKLLDIVNQPKIINNNTTHNTQFNIMNYLNNECKDAMNLTDFINELPFSLDDLEIMGTKGYQQSMEETFIKQLRDMEKTKRPIHCSDRKRKSFYIKDDNIWERDEDNSKIVNGLKKISQKHLGMLSSWTNYNKNWSHNERKQDFFNKSVQEVAKYNDYK